MKKIIFYITIGILIAVASFFAIRWQITRYKMLNDAYSYATRIADFVQTEFPDQVIDYNKKLEALGPK